MTVGQNSGTSKQYITNGVIAGSHYQGGTYDMVTSDYATSSKLTATDRANLNKAGLSEVQRIDVKGANGSVVNSGATFTIYQGAKTLVDNWNKDNPGDWQSVGGDVPGFVKQHLWYVDATTGEKLAEKETDQVLSTTNYDASNAAPSTITVGSKTYKLVVRNADGVYDSSDLKKDSVLATNNGVDIKASDLLGVKLKGNLSNSGRVGDISITNTVHGGIGNVFIAQRVKQDGTVDLNVYTPEMDDSNGKWTFKLTQSRYGGVNPVSKTNVAPKTATSGDTLQWYNSNNASAADLIFLYVPEEGNEQKAKITFVNDDTGATLSPAQDVTGQSGDTIAFSNASSTVTSLEKTYVYNGTTGTDVTNGSASDGFTNVKFPVYDSDDSTTQTFVVHFKNKTPDTPTYHQGKEESVTVHRTINYYDKVTGEKIPSNVISTNPYSDTPITFTRTQVLDANGAVAGYGTINADGKGFKSQDWHTSLGEVGSSSFDAHKSPDLSAYNYTAPEFRDGTSASVVQRDEITPTSKDLVYDVYYGHQTQAVTTKQDVTRRFHYIFTDGTTPESHLTPQADQTVSFTGTATKDLVTGKTGDTVWTPASGTLAQVAGQPVVGYHITGNVNANADGSANAVTVNPTSGDIDVTVVYTPDAKTPDTPQKAQVTIYDKTANKQLSTFDNNNGIKGSAISFDGEPQTLQAYLNSGYVFDSATDANGNSIGTASNINFGNFDSIDGNVQSFNIYLVHGTDTKTETATTNAHVHYVVAGNEANKPAAPADSPTQTINWTKTNTTDKVTGATTEGTWTPDKSGFTSVTSPNLTNYTPDQAVANFTTPQPNRDQVVTVVYNPNPEVAQKADLIVYDKTDNNKQLNNFDNSGKAGTQISFSGAANYVADLIAKGYKIDSFVNDQNVTSNPSSYGQITYDNFDNNAASDQHFKLYLVHDTENATQTKNTTSTVHYVVSDGKTTPPADHTETITWTQPGTKDKVTGTFTPTGNWTTPDHYTDVPTPNLEGYTPDRSNVPAPTPDPNTNPNTTVTYNPKTPEAPTYTGTEETRDVTRTINYYDKVTGAKIPSDLIAGNPTTQTVTLKRTHVVSSTGQDMGYGTISNDGKTFTKSAGDGWNTGSWDQVVSPDLQNAGYTAPDLAQADQVNVTSATKDAVVNVYYGHATVLVTPDKPQNPGDKINPNDPRNNPPAYPDGLTKADLQQSVTRTINYKGINENGQTVDVNGAPDGQNTYTQTVNFERHAVVDKVTGQVLGYDTNADTTTPVVTTTDENRAWMPASQNMDSVASKDPSAVGYDNVDIKTVGSMTVYPGQKVNDVTVTYTKNKTPEVTQKATLEIIDNNDANAPKQLASFGNEGKSEDQITFANSNEILQSYLNQGYKVQKTAGNLSGDAQSGYTYPTYGNTAQDFKIYLIHDTKDVTETAKATAQVHYEVADHGVAAPADSDLQTITYTRTNTVDKVTGQVTKEGTWKTDKDAFSNVVSPDLSKDGYTPSLETVQFNTPERNVNQRVTVVYNRSAQAADLQIIDDNDPQNQRVLATYSAGGESGKQISFDGSNDQLQSYLNHGYTFEKSEGQGMSGDATDGFTYPSFDNDSKTNQSFKIYLKHATGDKTETATTTAHVHYIMADGTKAPDDSETQTINWTRNNTVDQVTGAIVKEGTWKTDKDTFTDVDSPEVTGYTPGTKTVKFTTPERGVNQVVNVVYTKDAPTPDQQNALVVYQDVNDPAHPVDLGQSDQLTGQAGDAINYSTADKIAEYEKQGYVLVTNGFDPNGTKPSFDNVNDNTQTFYVTFKHGIQPVNPTTPGTPGDKINPNDPNPEGPKYPSGTTKENLTEEVTRTVTYEGAGDQTPSPVKTTLNFQGSGYLDKVTGKWTDANGKELADQTKGITWTIVDGTKDNGSFDLVPTKHIDGYTSQVVTAGADDGNGNVKSYTGINHSSQDINVVVKYSPVVAEKGNLIVKFHDDTDNKDLSGVGTDTGSQDVGTNVTYSPNTDLTNLENKGYVYVSTDGNIPASIVKGTTTVTIHVKHGTQPVNPSTPGKPDQPINPNDLDPNGPKYPTGTDKASIDKTITRTIHYEGADQYTPSDVEQPVHFTASGVLDKVTGEWTTPLTWSSETETFGQKNSPEIPGYHVVSVDKDSKDGKNVDSATIGHDGADYTVTVKYAKDEAPTPETTTGKVVYIDDTTGQSLKTDPLNGNVNANIDYTTQDKISTYENEGYKLVSNNFTDGKETFNVDASKNNFEVHLVHTYVPVTPENPGTPGDKINPNDPRPEDKQPKYPTGTTKDDLEKTITRTIQYKGAGEYTPESVQQPVHFTASGEIDRVTGKWSKQLTWSPDQTFGAKTTPKIPGYHVVSIDRDANGNDVAATPIAHTGSDYTVTVTYAPDEKPQAENAKLHIIDINDGNKEIGTFADQGDDNAAINFNGANTTVDSLIKAGYKVNSIKHTEKSGVVTDGGEGADYDTISSQWKFDDQPGFDQDFYVYLEHDYTPINPENAYGRTDLTRTVTETVHYVDEATNKPVATDYTNTLTFKAQGKVDKVTGKMLAIKSVENGQITYDYNVNNEKDISTAKDSDFVWSNPTTLAKVTSPTIGGYAIDAAKTTPSDLADGNDIKEITNVAYNHGNVEATVYYKANPVESHKAGLTIYANGKSVGTASITGEKGTAINFGQASEIVAAYLNNGYKFDHAQDVTNNKEMIGKSYSELNFGNFANENNSNQEFAIYLTKDVTPAKTQQNAQLVIQDVTPGQEMQLGSYTQPGLEGDAISFNDAAQRIQDLLGKGYVWDGATYNGANLSATDYAGIQFGNYDNTDDKSGISQKWVINLVHGTTPVNPDHPDDKDGYTKDYLDRTITRDVNYVDEQGKEMSGLTPEHQETKFQGSGYLDNVTGKWVTVENGKITGLAQGLTWTPDKDQSFKAIDAKTAEGYHVVSVTGSGISGFTVDTKTGAVTAQTVSKDTPSSKITVVYAKTPVTPVPANGSITYIDDTTGNTLESATFGGSVGDKINYTTADRITNYTNKGYKLVSNNFTDGNETFKQGENKFEVHFTHVTDTKDVTKTVTRDVTYVYEDGSQADTPVNQKVNFTGKTTTDKVTGATKTTWDNENQDFGATKSIDTTNYNIVRVSESNTNASVDMTNGVVAKEGVTPTSSNSTVVITLAKKPVTPTPIEKGSLTVIFHDDTEGHDISGYGTQTGNENVGTDVTYKSDSDLTKLEDKGYVYVSTDGTIPDKITKGNTVVTIHVKHGTRPVTPENPADPDKPVDPTKPNTPTPSNPNLAKTDLEKTITRTVKYQYADGTSAHADAVQTVNFKGQGTIDLVTGNLVNVDKGGNIIDQRGKITWDHEAQNFDTVAAIDHTGYYVSNITETGTIAKVDGTAVASETVNPNSQNSTIVITLTKSPETPVAAQGSIVYIDDTTGQELENATFGGNVGDKINYTTADRITNYTNKGYDLVSNNFNDGNETFKQGDNKFEVHLVHATTPITPENPGKPGQEVPNPKDPTNPHKIPDNFVPQDLTKTVTRDVTYVYEDGSQAATPVHQTFTFNGNGVVDLVTGQLVTVENGKITGAGHITWNAENHNFDATKSIDTTNYNIVRVSENNTNANVDMTNGVVAGETITPASQNSTVVITLAKKPVTPTPVQKGTVVVNYVDQTTGKTLETRTSTGNEGSNVNYSTKDTITKYTNQGYKLVSDGYPTGTVTYTNGTVTYEVDFVHDTVPVNPDQPGPKTPNMPINPNDPDGPKYPDGTQPAQLTKTITRTINYVGDGLNIPSIEKSLTFTANGVLDKVTGQWVTVDQDGKITGNANGMTWTVKGGNTDEGSFDEVAGPQTDGYHITNIAASNEDLGDINSTTGAVAGKTINHTSGNIVITINYAKNPVTPTPTPADQTVVGKQIVHYVDGDNNNAKLRDDNTNDTFVFTKSGKTGTWNADSHKYANANAPVIDGYVAEQKTYEGQTATPGDADKEITIVYHKIGKIIPVDPSGNPIPDAPTPGYHNDPTDPTKVTPNEPTPDVPGWTTNVPNVTPDTPTGDTKVPYTKPTPTQDKGSITITVHDVTDNTDLPEYGKTSGSQNVGTGFSYDKTGTFTSLTNKGYKIVNSDVTIPTEITKGDQNIVIYVEHTTTPITPENPGKPGQPINPNDPTGPQYPAGSDQVTKNVTRTITYVDNNGNQLHDPVEQTAHFTGTGVIDNVTGKWVTQITWTGNGDLSGQNTPVVDGYHVTNVSRDKDGNNVAKVTVNHGDSDYTVVVTYTPNGKIVPVDPNGNPIPDVPTPQYPTDPNDPAKVTPNEPVPTVPGYTPEVPTVTPDKPGEDTPVVYTPVTPATVQGKVTYIDDTTGKTITTDNFSGKVGDKISYTTADKIAGFESKGYELVSNDFKDGNENFTDGDNNFTVHLKHSEQTFTPQTPHGGDDENGKYATQKKTTFTVHYVGAGDKNPADHVETVQWHRHVSVDGVTGEIISTTPWTTDDSYSDVNTPVVNGYQADKDVVNAPQPDPNKDTVETVIYTPASTPVTPEQPATPGNPGGNDGETPNKVTPTTPATPGDNDGENGNKVTPQTPQQPVTPAESTPVAPTETQTPAMKQTAAQQPAAKSEAKKLPQTGNEANKSAEVLGLAALGLTGLVGLGKKRRKED
ncbi:mucin-binding protein [Limosilactobacillus walteri]|uniref:mucin-binding protein n=1 Tax=Limosilactobacillus walteri TaxID=2268022 RepID=UPI001CD8FC67|nr:LPXTG cell wall anchor domain-containing protein [Limosilactobacillus walteri]